jgi:methionine--tRNA ligase beta chain
MINIEEFKKLNLRVARIKEIIDHPNADKLYIVRVVIGEEEREVVAGIKKGYTKEELLGKLVVVVENLEPAVIRGVESKGMILAAQDGETLAVISPDRPVSPGSLVK